VALGRHALRRPYSRLRGPLDFAFVSLAITGLAATGLSPLRETLAPHLLPFLGALALPYALLPVLRDPRRANLFVGAFIYPLLFTTLFLWVSSQPSLIGPYARNAEPFGHANTTGAVCALAACALAGLSARAGTLAARVLHAGGAVLAVLLSISSSSRGAVIALALAVLSVAAFFLLRRGRALPFILVAAVVGSGAFLSEPRLRAFVRSGAWSADANESNAQRVAMIVGGFKLGAARPLTGWGPGAVPHVFPRVRAPLPGLPDNYLQLHNTPAQLAATLGLAGLLAAALLVVALGLRFRALLRQTSDPRVTAPLLASLICGGALLLFDHSFAIPAFALLAALPVAALVLADPDARASGIKPAPAFSKPTFSGSVPVLVAGGVVLAFSMPVGRDLAARAAWSAALDHAAADQPAPYAACLRRAIALAPADPFYADQLASHLTTGHPFPALRPPAPDAAIPVLQAALAHNPQHESASYNLGWLLLSSTRPDPAAARAHFTAAARLAPARAGVFHGLALARIRSSEIVPPINILAAEVLLDPAFAWSPHWREPALAPLRPAALAAAADFLSARSLAPDFVSLLRRPGDAVDAASAFRRVRPGHGVLYGHPDGPPPADVPVLLNLNLPPELRAALPPRGFVSPADLLACAALAP
jgi:O-antigen ligase